MEGTSADIDRKLERRGEIIMVVLIVDDSDEKVARIERCLRDAVPNASLEIDCAQSVISALNLLAGRSYDLLVLDLVLPMRDVGEPIDRGGQTILHEIQSDGDCRRPSHIVCLTAYEDTIGDEVHAAERGIAHVIGYSALTSDWSHRLANVARYVEERVAAARTNPPDWNKDIAIITSSPIVELNAVRSLPCEFIPEYNGSDSLYYHLTSWTTNFSDPLSVVACAAPRMGMTAACVTASKVIERWRPKMLVMTGIAAGTKKSLRFGDVIVAESAFDYGSGKIIQQKDGKRLFTPSPNQLDIDAALHAVLQRWEQEQRGMDDVHRAGKILQVDPPKLILGMIASGAAVVQSAELVEEILLSSRKVVGLDMEAYAIFHAAYLSSKPSPRVLVVKSVSDYADGRKNDRWQAYAATTSAQFVYQFLTGTPEIWSK